MADGSVMPGETVPRGRFPMPRIAPELAAVISLAVGWVHLAYWQSHWQEWWGYGLFFLGTGVAQGLFAAVIALRPSPHAALAGILGNLAIVGTYFLSRTDGVPVGPHDGIAERASTIDWATTAGEIALVAVLLTMVGVGARRRTVNAMLLAGALLWALRLTGQF
jgi:hypothetical protein